MGAGGHLAGAAAASGGGAGAFELFRGDALDTYRDWPVPAAIISDGAYGVRGFHGDTAGPAGLPDWYRPHIQCWSAAAAPATTLWFWNTEIGWASVHPVLAEYGWDYVELLVWDKGRAHIAGNVNGRTIRRFPVVTEVCAFYQRRLTLPGHGGPVPVDGALRYRWRHAHDLTNVWSRPPLHDSERLKGTGRRAAPRVYKPTAASAAHLNQKPLAFMERLVEAVTEPGDVIWEPFGGLCSASVAAVTLGRRAFAAETDPAFADLAAARVRQCQGPGEEAADQASVKAGG